MRESTGGNMDNKEELERAIEFFVRAQSNFHPGSAAYKYFALALKKMGSVSLDKEKEKSFRCGGNCKCG